MFCGCCLQVVTETCSCVKLFHETVLCLLHVCRSHEDGSVRFWDVSGGLCLQLLYKLDTASLFGIETLPHAGSSTTDLSDDWPPFRKVSTYLVLFQLAEING